MRWIVAAFASLCLLAAAGARPDDLRGHEQTAAHLVQTHGGARVDHRLSAFALPRVARLAEPVRTCTVVYVRPTVEPPDPSLPAAVSRGPPRG